MDREELEKKYGKIWTTGELSKEFTVYGFAAPFCIVTNKGTGRKGIIEFQHRPRYYFDFREEG